MKFLKGVVPITFNEPEHKYYLDGEQLTSVSSLIHLYTPEFDPDGSILRNCSIKRGVSEGELRKEWDKERDDACDRGHQLHHEAEFWIDNKRFKPKGKWRDVVSQIAGLPFKGSLISETIIYSDKLKLAGTVDVIEEIAPKTCNIWDFKQNKKLSYKSFFKRGEGYSKMLYPVDHLLNCNYILYSLQLQIYGILLEQNGYKVGDKTLIYIPPKTRIIELHPIQDLKKEAWDLIEHFLSF